MRMVLRLASQKPFSLFQTSTTSRIVHFLDDNEMTPTGFKRAFSLSSQKCIRIHLLDDNENGDFQTSKCHFGII